jgi:hypothetical protein
VYRIADGTLQEAVIRRGHRSSLTAAAHSAQVQQQGEELSPQALATTARLESIWRNRKVRFASSKQFIKAFRAHGSVSAWRFHRGAGRLVLPTQGDETETLLLLERAGDTTIRRHMKTQGQATPFDPLYEEYFERPDTMKVKSLPCRLSKDLAPLEATRKPVPGRHREGHETRGWHVHHLMPRVEGGLGMVSNPCVLHPVCHG